MQLSSENFTIASEGTVEIPGNCNVTLFLSNEAPVTLLGAHGVGNVQPSTMSRVRFRNETGEPGSIHMSSPKEFGYSVSIGSLNRKETVDREPPPQPAVGMNFLQQLRRQFRQEMGVMREAFAEPQVAALGGGYEIEDDMLDEFEEEQAARLAKERKEKAAKEKAEKQKAASDPQQNRSSATESPADGGKNPQQASDGPGGTKNERSTPSGGSEA